MKQYKLSNTFAVIVVCIFVFGLIFLIASNSSSSNSPAPVIPIPPEQNSVAAATTPTPPAEPATSFSDGTFIVGTDIQPGTYRSSANENNCYYARLSGFGGTDDEIIANNNIQGAAIVSIAPSDKGFQTKGCGTWTQISPAPTSQSVKSNATAATTPTNSNPPPQPPQPAASNNSGWASYANTSFTDILNDPGYYLYKKIKIVGIVFDFLGAGGRGGTENYVEIAPLAGISSPTNRIMLQVNSNANYLLATQNLSTWANMSSGGGNLADGVIAYGVVQPSASFSLTSGGDTSYPVIEISRLDQCNVFACDTGASSIFPSGLTTAASTQSAANNTNQPQNATPPSTPTNSRYFQLNITGVCTNYGNNGTIILTGYPYANGYEVPSDDISAWSDGDVAFTIPTSITAGTYQVDVRGYMQGTGSCPDVNGGSITVP